MDRADVYVLTTERPDRPGGMERFVATFAAALEARGHAVRVFHREGCAPGWLSDPPGRGLRGLVAGALQGYFVGRCARRALDDGVRLIVSNSTVGWWPLKTRAARVHFYHGTYPGQAEAIRPFVRRTGYLKLKWWDGMVLERISGRGKLCLANSEQTTREVASFFGHECATVWYPLDLDHFRPLDPRACRKELGLDPDVPIGLFVGSSHPQKGLDTVLRLIDTFIEVEWVLVLRGDAPRDLAGNRALVVEDATYDRLPVLYSAADVFVCPSRYEPFGFVVAEALACGVPTVASPGGASRLLLDEPPLDRLLVPSAEDPGWFERAVAHVLEHPEGYREAVMRYARPRIEALMEPGAWVDRFLERVGL